MRSRRKLGPLGLVFVLIAGVGGCGPGPSTEKQAAKWADDVVRALRSADEETQAAKAVKRVPPAVSDEELARLREELDDAIDEVVCNGAEILVKAVEANKSTNFDWNGWASKQLDPQLASDFSTDTINEMGNELDQALDALEDDLPLLTGVADACGIAHSGF